MWMSKNQKRYFECGCQKNIQQLQTNIKNNTKEYKNKCNKNMPKPRTPFKSSGNIFWLFDGQMPSSACLAFWRQTFLRGNTQLVTTSKECWCRDVCNAARDAVAHRTRSSCFSLARRRGCFQPKHRSPCPAFAMATAAPPVQSSRATPAENGYSTMGEST